MEDQDAEIVTLDMAEDAFEATPNATTARVLLETAEGYENDDMIGAGELAKIKARVAPLLPTT